MNIAIITARGGSKRIPKKNIKDFCGKPIIAYSIEAALESKCFDEVMVSTDSEEIAKTAIQYGAKIPFFRNASTSNDYATTSDVLLEVLETYRDKLKKEYDIFCCIYPTAPFVTSEKLIQGMQLLKDGGADSLLPVVPFSFPPQRGMIIKNKRLKYKSPEYEKSRSQDLENIYHDCGQFYICRVREFMKCHSLVTSNTMPMIISEEEVQDIDNLSDWNIAEIKYKKFVLGKDE